MKGVKNIYTAIFKKVKGGYTVWLAELPGVISEGRTRKEAEENIKDALELTLETNRIMSFKDAVGDIEHSIIYSPATAAMA